MRVGTILVGVGALALAACNQSRAGVNDKILFTPVECGQLSCDFDDSVGVFGTIALQITGIDGQATAGLDLASRDTSVATVERRDDVGNAPAWDLHAHAAGVVEVAAVDTDGTEIDFVQIGIQDVTRLTMLPVVGDVVGPSTEADYDEAFTVNADEPVSWSIRPVIAGDVTTMGRFSFETVLDAGGPDLTQFETASSDRPNGYLYVQLPAGDYPVRFEVTEDIDVAVEAIIHAQ
jgi:hypothetical protein